MARALRKDHKTKEIIELDLRELRSHEIAFLPVSDRIISEAENATASTNTFAADAVHVCTYKEIAQHSRLDGFLCDDIHYERFKPQAPVKTIAGTSKCNAQMHEYGPVSAGIVSTEQPAARMVGLQCRQFSYYLSTYCYVSNNAYPFDDPFVFGL